ncbi:SDR family NAD(P)-dependent oxidoreductase [Dietzia alimentaria]|uniref:SDR family NAD(P)-dependent oxidoreductase n=1 Tax=Dietzia alimentaria TaxID=665550 RepID=UPI00029B4969|nr:SDR family oxidoreductase [Dietzia alimentaria]
MSASSGTAGTGSPKTTVVIGAASGIGAATAEHLRLQGHRVIAADLVSSESVLPVDVADEATVHALFESVMTECGSFTGVVNCAGTSTFSPVVEHDSAEFRRILDISLAGAFHVLKHAGSRVDEGGSLVTLASLNGTQPGTGLAAYCTAKAGLLMLSQVTALELAPRQIRVNTVSPGLVVTPLTSPAMDIPGVREDYIENTPLGRPGTGLEIAAACEYLLSDGAAWTTGEDMQVNGGAHLKRYPDMLTLIGKAFG